MSAALGVPADARRRPGVRSLTNKVALLFAGVVLLAFGVVYFYIVPQLQSNLEQQAFDELAGGAGQYSGVIEAVMDTDDPGRRVDTRVRRAAEQVDARVTLLGLQRSETGSGFFYQITDSNVDRPSVLRDLPPKGAEIAPGGRGRAPGREQAGAGGGEQAGAAAEVCPGCPPPDISISVADAAVDGGEVETGLGRSRGELIAQAAAPLRETPDDPPEWVAVYSRPIEDISEAGELIQRQVLVAGVLAVLVALAGGWLVARAVARRVWRLESAARGFGAGRPVQPLPIDSEDELGQLTRTFNEMQEQLARVDRSRREFIANASHELRTPIFSLAGFAELLQDEELDPQTRERFLTSMREQIERLQRLAADLLDLSRLDAGALEIHPRETDVAEVAEAVIHEFAPVTAERRTRLKVDLPPGGLEAYCDPDLVAQIVRILLDNALRHNPEGTPVTVAASRRNGAVELTVQDRGPGLDSEAAERVFDRFYTRDAASGSGLGLAIARELAERMDGAIRLHSAPGDTAFTLVLPVVAGGAGGDGAVRRAAAGARPEHATAADGAASTRA
jgi:two-component system OmpR family sensor kinase